MGDELKAKNNHTNRLFKIITTVLCFLFVSLTLWTANTIRDLVIGAATGRVNYSRDSVLVQDHEQWIDDWYDVLKVPERDERQDSGIEDLKRRVEEIERRMR